MDGHSGFRPAVLIDPVRLIFLVIPERRLVQPGFVESLFAQQSSRADCLDLSAEDFGKILDPVSDRS